MKKPFSLSAVLLLAICFALTGCGSDTTEYTTQDLADQSRQQTKAQPTEQRQEQQTATANPELSSGQWQDNVYTNDVFQLQFTLPEGWTQATEEEIAATMDLGNQILADETQDAAELAALTTVYHMMAKDEATGSSLVLMAEKQTSDSVTAEVYLNTLKDQLQEITALHYEVGEPTSQQVAGQNFIALPTTLPDSGLEQYYYARRQGDDMVVIILSGPSDSGLPELLSLFTPVESEAFSS